MNEVVDIIKVIRDVLKNRSIAVDLAILQKLLYKFRNVHRKFKFYRTFKQIQSLMKKLALLRLCTTFDKSFNNWYVW